MGVKFTIVLDTDDLEGLHDAFTMSKILYNKYYSPRTIGPRASLSKIELIKMVREIANKVERGKMDSSLRSSKDFVDHRWDSLIKP